MRESEREKKKKKKIEDRDTKRKRKRKGERELVKKEENKGKKFRSTEYTRIFSPVMEFNVELLCFGSSNSRFNGVTSWPALSVLNSRIPWPLPLSLRKGKKKKKKRKEKIIIRQNNRFNFISSIFRLKNLLIFLITL